jgi:signal transduction histidine kinase
MIEIVKNPVFVFTAVVIMVFLGLGFFVYNTNKKELSNKIFLGMCFAAVSWMFSILVVFNSVNILYILYFARAALATSVWIAFFMFYFTYVFPTPNTNYKLSIRLVFLFSCVVSFIGATPWVLKDIEVVDTVQKSHYGPGFSVVFLYFLLYFFFSLYNLTSKRKKLTTVQISQVNYVLVGYAISLSLTLTTNLIIPLVTSNIYLSQYGPSMVIFFILFVAYAILKYHLFSIKVFAVQLLSLVISFIIFVKMLISSGPERVLNGVLFVFVLIFVFLLVRNTMKEVKNRQKIEQLAEDFVVANEQLRQMDKQKSDFISIASHQLRTPLTAIKGYASMILEGSFGEVSSKAKEAIFKIFEANQRMIMTVENFLTMSRLERGKMFYKFEVIDLQKIVKSVVEELRPVAKGVSLEINFRENVGRQYLINADFIKVKQVIHNLLADSIRHTPKGFIDVFLTLSQYGDYMTLAISDTGEGATKEQIKNLFERRFEGDFKLTTINQQNDTELYIVKEIVKDHGGQVWAESEGPGRGKTFFVEIPTLKGKIM